MALIMDAEIQTGVVVPAAYINIDIEGLDKQVVMRVEGGQEVYDHHYWDMKVKVNVHVAHGSEPLIAPLFPKQILKVTNIAELDVQNPIAWGYNKLKLQPQFSTAIDG